jgi:hypothetical protein
MKSRWLLVHDQSDFDAHQVGVGRELSCPSRPNKFLVEGRVEERREADRYP